MSKSISNIATYQIGSIVKIKTSFMGEPVGVKAFVYEHYSGGGLSVITENGKDLGGFSVDDQMDHLEYYSDSGKTYHFKNVMQLHDDFRSGIFTPFFKIPKYERRK